MGVVRSLKSHYKLYWLRHWSTQHGIPTNHHSITTRSKILPVVYCSYIMAALLAGSFALCIHYNIRPGTYVHQISMHYMHWKIASMADPTPDWALIYWASEGKLSKGVNYCIYMHTDTDTNWGDTYLTYKAKFSNRTLKHSYAVNWSTVMR